MVAITYVAVAASNTWSRANTSGFERWNHTNSSGSGTDIGINAKNSASECFAAIAKPNRRVPIVRQSQSKIAVPSSGFQLECNSRIATQSKFVSAWWVRACLSRRWTAENLLLPFHTRILHRIGSVSNQEDFGMRAIKFRLRFISLTTLFTFPFTVPAKFAPQTRRTRFGVIANAF